MRTAASSPSPAVSRVRRKPADPAEVLKPLQGTWYTEGKVYPSPYGPAATWRSHEHTEWLWGKRFLLHHWRARLDERPYEGLTVLGEEEGDGYFAQFYDNAGRSTRYVLTLSGREWKFSGPGERGCCTFAADGDSIDVRWEWRDGRGWKPLCERRATRFLQAF